MLNQKSIFFFLHPISFWIHSCISYLASFIRSLTQPLGFECLFMIQGWVHRGDGHKLGVLKQHGERSDRDMNEHEGGYEGGGGYLAVFTFFTYILYFY